MNKLTILASLNRIAFSLDKSGYYKEADIIANSMIKLAMNDEVPETFEDIYKYKQLDDLTELVPTALDKLRQKAKQFTDLIINRVAKDPSFELKDPTKSQISVVFNDLASFYKERGFRAIEGFRFPTKEENLLILQEAKRLQEILFQYIDNYNGQPINFDETTTIQSNISKEELENSIQEDQIQNAYNTYQSNGGKADFMSYKKEFISLVDNILNNKFSSTGLQIAEERFKRKNPYWDPRDWFEIIKSQIFNNLK